MRTIDWRWWREEGKCPLCGLKARLPARAWSEPTRNRFVAAANPMAPFLTTAMLLHKRADGGWCPSNGVQRSVPADEVKNP